MKEKSEEMIEITNVMPEIMTEAEKEKERGNEREKEIVNGMQTVSENVVDVAGVRRGEINTRRSTDPALGHLTGETGWLLNKSVMIFAQVYFFQVVFHLSIKIIL